MTPDLRAILDCPSPEGWRELVAFLDSLAEEELTEGLAAAIAQALSGRWPSAIRQAPRAWLAAETPLARRDQLRPLWAWAALELGSGDIEGEDAQDAADPFAPLRDERLGLEIHDEPAAPLLGAQGRCVARIDGWDPNHGDGRVLLHDLDAVSGRQLAEGGALLPHPCAVIQGAFSLDGRYLVAAWIHAFGAYASLMVLDRRGLAAGPLWERLFTPPVPDDPGEGEEEFFPEGAPFLVFLGEDRVGGYDAFRGRLRVFSLRDGSPLEDLALPLGARALAGAASGAVAYLDGAGRLGGLTPDRRPLSADEGQGERWETLLFDEAGELWTIAGSTAQRWRVAGAKLAPGARFALHRKEPAAVALPGGGVRLVSARPDHLWIHDLPGGSYCRVDMGDLWAQLAPGGLSLSPCGAHAITREDGQGLVILLQLDAICAAEAGARW